MDTVQVEQQTCRMCFVSGNFLMNIFDKRDIGLSIAQIIGEHFQCEVNETDFLPSFICCECWSKTKSFHEFHQWVKSAQSNYLTQLFRTKVKEENPSSELNINSEFETWQHAREFVKSSFVECNVDVDGMIGTIQKVFEKQNKCLEPLRNHFQNGEIEVAETVAENAEQQVNIRKLSEKKKTNQLDSKLLHKYFDMTCDMCPAEFESFEDAQRHYLDEHNILNGHIKCCKMKFKLRCHIRDHINWHLNPEMYRCKFCGKNMVGKVALNCHVKQHTKVDDKRHQCNLCGKYLNSKQSLSKHIQVHATKESKPFVCDICGKGYPRKETLRLHILATHVRTEIKIECELCKKQFPIKERLKTHIISVHGSGVEICEICGKSCKTKYLLQAHLLTHAIKKPKPCVQCEYCGEWLQSSSGIHYHKQLHTTGIQQCTQCDLQFPNRVSLQIHVRNHHKARKYKCNFCEKAYVTPYKLKEHLESHTGQGSYACEYCPMVFKARNSRTSHYRRTHSVEWRRDQAKKNSASSKPTKELN